jgi:hypothetical protein
MFLILKFEHHKKENNHYYYVMGWKEAHLFNAPIHKEKFDIYDEAVSYFKEIENECAFVSMFEYIGGKRKWIADSEDKSAIVDKK